MLSTHLCPNTIYYDEKWKYVLAQTYFGQVSNSTALTFLDHMKNNTFISGQSQVFFF